MKKNHKKKILVLALVLILLSFAIAGGSLAWYSTVGKATNVITVGSINVAQLETDELGQPFEQGQMLIPVSDHREVQADPNFIHKIVAVKNTGNNPAYVRTWIAIPAQLEGMLCYLTDSVHWLAPTDRVTGSISGVSYSAYCYTYKDILAPGETTAPLLEGVYLDPAVDILDNPATDSTNLEFCTLAAEGSYVFSGYEILDASGTPLAGKLVDLLVSTQAVQSENFDNRTMALEMAFGKPNVSTAVPFFHTP